MAKLILKHNGTPVDLIVDAYLDPEDIVEDTQDQIGATFDTATATSVSWTPPESPLGTGYTITLTGDSTVELPAVAYAGSDIVSGSFEIIHDTSIYEPSASSNWREGETRIIKWGRPARRHRHRGAVPLGRHGQRRRPPGEDGTQPIATGLDLEEDDTFSWAIPEGIPLSNTARIRLTGDGAEVGEYTGDPVVSLPFILRAPHRPCRVS